MLRQLAPQTEVAHLNRAVERQEYVGRLEVAVHDPPLVHVLYRLADLREVAPNHPLLKARLPLLRLTNLALEVARGRPLEDDDELIALDEGVKVFDHVRVAKRLQQPHLLQALVPRLCVHRVDRDLLERHDRVVGLAPRPVDDGELALADGLDHFVILHARHASRLRARVPHRAARVHRYRRARVGLGLRVAVALTVVAGRLALATHGRLVRLDLTAATHGHSTQRVTARRRRRRRRTPAPGAQSMG
mmetsp:Transcript_3068/g.6206  ORF Transcript_3068/g.6206 Transcript_3068/m.6206 type:complete len:247 (-) Transcript_3068:213-953(-)